jgi:hypothetical protein
MAVPIASSIIILAVGSVVILNRPSSNNGNLDNDQPPAQSSSNAELPIVDQVIQFPNQSIPYTSELEEVETLTTKQVKGLNNLFNAFTKVGNSFEPVEPGRATTYERWNALCIGEQGKFGCPKSAKHEILSYGDLKVLDIQRLGSL